MAKQPNKTLIGAFVVGAVILAVTGIMIFSSGKFFTEKYYFILYFDSSVNGLDIGAPVQFSGVQIGSVVDIKVRYESDDLSDIRIPVFIEIEPGIITDAPEFQKTAGYRSFVKQVEKLQETGKLMQLLIKEGLRASLEKQSLVTGKLFVQLGFHPDKPIRLLGGESEFEEIPTIPSALDEIADKLKKLPLDELVEKATAMVAGLERLVNSPELQDAIVNLDKALKSINQLINNLDGEIQPISAGIQEAIKDASTALEQAGETLKVVEDELSEGSPVRYELSTALQEITATARSLRVLIDYLQQNPESLLRGKGGE